MPITLSKKVSPKRKRQKQCHFPGCTIIFEGIGPSKYCEEHRKIKYRKVINKILLERKLAKRIPIENANQTIKHKSGNVEHKECKCALEGCENTFKITIIPRTFVYPQYCETHRNAYKRARFIESQNKCQK